MRGRPKLRDDLIIVVQQYRGEQTYIVKDPETHKYFRFKPLEVLIMQQFTGEHTFAQLAAGLAEQGLPLSEAKLQKFAGRLSKMELFERTLGEKSTLLMERMRAERHRRVKGTHYEGSLLRMRWSAGDPDELFDRWMPVLRLFFTRTFIGISLALFAVYLGVFVLRWGDIANGITAMYSVEFYTLQNIVLFWGTAMVVIIIHELGHGVTCKYFGGQVHELGAMLLYFQPAFYCNVNDAWTFSKLSQRLWVTAAGSWIQLVVAGIAAIVWVIVDPSSVISRVAFFAVLVGGATTVIANANPLIPLDGYYALSDYLEIPNLRQRALAHVTWLIRRHVIRLNVPEPPVADLRERRALVTYGVLAIAYIFAILGLVATVVMGWASRAFGVVGVLGFVLLLWVMLRTTIREWARAVATSLREHRARLLRGRVVGSVAGLAVVLLVMSVLVPWPLLVKGRFVAAPVFEAPLTSPDAGVLTEIYAGEGDSVDAGAVVVRLRNFTLEREVVSLERVVDSLGVSALRARALGLDAALRQAELARDEAAARLLGARERVRRLTLRAPVSGVLVTRRLRERVGRAFEAGETVASVSVLDSLELRVTLDRAGATLVAAGQRASLLPYATPRRAVEAPVHSVAPAADSSDALEARIRVPSGLDGLYPGVTGEAKIVVRQTSVLLAMWWAVRKRIRNDLLL